MIRASLTLKSSNKKTGPIPVSCSSRNTCPTSCPFYNSGCYAEHGPVAIHWRKVSEGTRGLSWSDFCAEVSKLPDGTLWRHNSCGDLPGIDEDVDMDMLQSLIDANHGKLGFSYTHKLHLAALIKANNNGLVINVSCHSIDQAASILDSGIPATVACKDSSIDGSRHRGYDVKVCQHYMNGTQCIDCKWCATYPRTFIIAHPVHGSRSKIAAEACQD